MKKTFIICLMTVPLFVMSGCSLIFEDPSTLILPPATTQEQYVERVLINQFLSNDERLEIPENMDHPAAVVDLDVDGDGTKEKLVFWTKRNGYEVGAMLLKEEPTGDWMALDQIKQYGKGIDYFKLLDIDKDGKQKVCIGADMGGYNVLYVYRVGEKGFEAIDQINYTRLQIVDINNDGAYAVLCVLNDSSETTPTTTLFKYEFKNEAQCVYQKTYDGNCVDLKYGNVGHNKQGIYLVHTGDYINYDVELLLPNAKNGFDEQMSARVLNVNSSSSGLSLIGDATGDNVLDIRTVIKPIEASKHTAGDYIKAWKRWDGRDGLEYGYGVLDNNSDGYTFVLPTESLDQVRYQFITEKGSSQVRFYDGANSEPAFILYAQSETEAENIKNKEGIISLGTSPSHQRSYFARCNRSTFAKQPINENIIREAFQIEGGQ